MDLCIYNLIFNYKCACDTLVVSFETDCSPFQKDIANALIEFNNGLINNSLLKSSSCSFTQHQYECNEEEVEVKTAYTLKYKFVSTSSNEDASRACILSRHMLKFQKRLEDMNLDKIV